MTGRVLRPRGARQTVVPTLTEPKLIENDIRDEIRIILDNEQFIKAYWDTTIGTNRQDREDTAKFEPFGQEEFNIGMKDLIGCTGLIVVSSQGAYLAHWWESTDFGNTRRLRARALKGLKEGLRFHPSLAAYASQLRGAAAFLMTPATSNNLMYPNEVELIRATVSDIIPDVTFQTLPYGPLDEEDLDLEGPRSELRGACMVQYKPASVQGGLSHKVFVENKSVDLSWT
jgi:hypothetical protein